MATTETLLTASLVAVMAAGARAQVAWQLATPQIAPPPRNAHAMSGEPLGRVLLFGGYDSPTSVFYNDTWTYDWLVWRRLTPAHTPSPRSLFALAFDRLRNRVVLFGGQMFSAYYNDTWEWDGVDWIARQPATAPSPRAGMGMTFDLPRANTVLFGGGYVIVNQNRVVFADTWTWDGTVWRNVPTAVTPPARWSHALTADLARSSVVLFGGQLANRSALGDTWTFDGSTWTQQLPAHTPPPRQSTSMVFDQARGRTVLFGGIDVGPPTQFADTWEWNGSDWLQRLPTGTSPSPRWSAAAVFEPANGRVVLFGGVSGGSPYPANAETWTYGPDPAPLANPFGAGCAGTGGTPLLTGTPAGVGGTLQLVMSGLSSSPLAGLVIGTSRTLWGTTPLPFDLGVYGMPGCMLLSSPDVSLVVAASAGTATHSIAVPANASLAGMLVYSQCVSFDATVNVGGAVSSNGLEVRIGGG